MGGIQLHAPRGKGRRRLLVVAVALVAVVVVATARAASVIWETTWGGPLSEVTNGAAVASDGSSYLTGFTNSFDLSGQQQVFLTKFAADASLGWQRTFQGPEQFRTDEGKVSGRSRRTRQSARGRASPSAPTGASTQRGSRRGR